MTPQSIMAARSNMMYGQQPYSALQQQQAALHGQLGMNSGVTSGLHILQGEAHGSGSSGALGGGGFPDFGRTTAGDGLQVTGRGMASGSKHDMGSSLSAEGRGGSSGGHSGGDGGETLYLKSADDGN